MSASTPGCEAGGLGFEHREGEEVWLRVTPSACEGFDLGQPPCWSEPEVSAADPGVESRVMVEHLDPRDTIRLESEELVEAAPLRMVHEDGGPCSGLRRDGLCVPPVVGRMGFVQGAGSGMPLQPDGHQFVLEAGQQGDRVARLAGDAGAFRAVWAFEHCVPGLREQGSLPGHRRGVVRVVSDESEVDRRVAQGGAQVGQATCVGFTVDDPLAVAGIM